MKSSQRTSLMTSRVTNYISLNLVVETILVILTFKIFYLLVIKFPEDVFTTLADKLTYNWKQFARCLLIDELAIGSSKKEFSTTREQTFQVLNQWRKDNPLKTWRDMKVGLIFCKRKDLIYECERSRFLIQRNLFFLAKNIP